MAAVTKHMESEDGTLRPLDRTRPAGAPPTAAATGPAVRKRGRAQVQEIEEQIRQLCLSLFFREDAPIRSLGLTSAIRGEGKTFLAMATADVLAHDYSLPTTIVECNWDNRCLHEHFNLRPTPGLAEWLRGECDVADIRQPVTANLTVITAGDSRRDAVKLLRQLRQDGISDLLASPDEALIMDLPPVVASVYGALAASIADSLVVVVRSRVTPAPVIAEAMEQISDMPVQGLILNQTHSRIPRWLQALL